MKNTEYLLSILRIALGFVFLWAFFDKSFGFGFSTPPESSWLNGVSPTSGFLQFGTKGIFNPVFQSLAGFSIIDWLFMLGLFAVGTALILGMGVKVAGYAGSMMMFLIYLSLFPPVQNPLIDQHIIYILVLLCFTFAPTTGSTLGLGKWWRRTSLVKKMPWLI